MSLQVLPPKNKRENPFVSLRRANQPIRQILSSESAATPGKNAMLSPGEGASPVYLAVFDGRLARSPETSATPQEAEVTVTEVAVKVTGVEALSKAFNNFGKAPSGKVADNHMVGDTKKTSARNSLAARLKKMSLTDDERGGAIMHILAQMKVIATYYGMVESDREKERARLAMLPNEELAQNVYAYDLAVSHVEIMSDEAIARAYVIKHDPGLKEFYDARSASEEALNRVADFDSVAATLTGSRKSANSKKK